MIRRSLFIGSGLVVVLALSYIAFLDVSEKIKKDLLEQTKSALSDKGVEGIEAKIQGEGLALSRTVTLTGFTYSQSTKEKIEDYVYRVEGVGAVDNQIVIQKPKYYVPVDTAIKRIQPTQKSTPVVEVKSVVKPAVVQVPEEPKKAIAVAEANEVTSTSVVTAPKLPEVVKTIEVSTIEVIQPSVVTPVVQPPKVVEPVQVTE